MYQNAQTAEQDWTRLRAVLSVPHADIPNAGNEFRIGDRVKVKDNRFIGSSSVGFEHRNKYGYIVDINYNSGYCVLDIDVHKSGIWLKEIEKVDSDWDE